MNASLVAFYRDTPKPANLVELISGIHKILARHAALRFTPYESRQVHATIVGLEGLRVGNQIVSTNFVELRGKVKLLRLQELAEQLLASRHLPIPVRIGGFSAARDYGFLSRGQHPRAHSFSIQGQIAVAMGWPARDQSFPPTLHLLRRELESFGALHKYHASETDADNDLFFVLGQVDHREQNADLEQAAEEQVRDYLSNQEHYIECRPNTLSFVAYEEPTLALARTRQFGVESIATTPQALADWYDAAV